MTLPYCPRFIYGPANTILDLRLPTTPWDKILVGVGGDIEADSLARASYFIRREELLTTMALGDQLHALLEDIDNQYKLTYARPKTLIPPDTLEVTSKRPGITVRARRVP